MWFKDFAGLTFYYTAKIFVRAFFTIYNRIEVRGLENVPRKGPLVVASTHHSNLDPPAIGCVFPRKLYYMAKAELFKNKFFGWLIKSLGAIPLPRQQKQASVSAIKTAIKCLKNNSAVIIFPEGGRGPEGVLRPLEPGVVFISQKADAPILPCVIKGTSKAMPIGASYIKPTKIRIVFGKVLSPEDYPDRESYLLALRESLLELINQD